MRTKSTKSLTFSTWRGMQITKDRVTSVSNPQTEAQMGQRLKMPLVAQARTKLKGLVNHSFQGVDYGYKSLYQFSALNLKKGAITIGEYTPKGISDMGAANYIVSTGSLSPFLIGVSNDDYITQTGDTWKSTDGRENGDEKACLAPAIGGLGNLEYTQSVAAASPTDAELYNFFLNTLLENVQTDQLSFLFQEGGTTIALDANGGEETANLSNIWLYRIVAGSTNVDEQEISFSLRSGEDWTSAGNKHLYLIFGETAAIQCQVTYTPATTGDNATVGSIKLAKGSGNEWLTNINNAKTNIWGGTPFGVSSYVNGGIGVNMGTSDEYQTAPFTIGHAENSLPFKAVAIINSRFVNNVWQRSRQQMAVLEYNPYFNAENVGETYKKSSTASAKFLNNGSETTGISGNSGSSILTLIDTVKSQG